LNTPAERDPAVLILTTAPSGEVAALLAQTLVEEGLAACASQVPGVLSLYRWAGNVEEAAEVLVLFKTRAVHQDALMRRLAELHPYEVPEVLVLPVIGGHIPYLDWIAEATPTDA
jgi:periplasmic divalent cation tolerance protein